MELLLGYFKAIPVRNGRGVRWIGVGTQLESGGGSRKKRTCGYNGERGQILPFLCVLTNRMTLI